MSGAFSGGAPGWSPLPFSSRLACSSNARFIMCPRGSKSGPGRRRRSAGLLRSRSCTSCLLPYTISGRRAVSDSAGSEHLKGGVDRGGNRRRQHKNNLPRAFRIQAGRNTTTLCIGHAVERPPMAPAPHPVKSSLWLEEPALAVSSPTLWSVPPIHYADVKKHNTRDQSELRVHHTLDSVVIPLRPPDQPSC